MSELELSKLNKEFNQIIIKIEMIYDNKPYFLQLVSSFKANSEFDL